MPTDTSYSWAEFKEDCASSCPGRICPDLWGVPYQSSVSHTDHQKCLAFLLFCPDLLQKGCLGRAQEPRHPMVHSLRLSHIHNYEMRYVSGYCPDESFLHPSINLLAKNLPSAFQTSHLPPQPTEAPSSRHSIPAQ